MNSQMTRIRTVLRYLVLGPIIALGLLSIIATGSGGDTLEVEGCLVVLGGGIGPDCGPPPPPPPPLPTVAFQAATSATADEAAGNHAINLVLSSSTPTEIFVVVTDARSGTATPGTDYIQVGLTSANGFTFPHGAIQETFILTVLADTLVEGNETVDLQLVNVTGAVLGVQTTHEITITDDDLIDLIDLSLSKTVNNATPAVGNSVVFTITVSNAAGMTDASGVVVTDALPVGYRYVSDDGGAATAVAGNTVTWTVGNLAQGTSTSLDITATVMPGGAPYVNDAEVTAANETDLDSTPGDGTGDDFAMVGTTPTDFTQIPPPNFTVAFIGDQGSSSDALAVLSLIKSEGADMVLHQGDFDYLNNPNAWDQRINDVLGPDFPYFASIGNHDTSVWIGYQGKLADRLARIPEANCTGDLGVKSSCRYQGLFFILSGVGTMGSGHESYIRDELAQSDAIWRICSWHKNQRNMQIGGKGSETGWGVYEACREGGAIIATAHEHSYERTKTLISMQNQSIDPEWPDPQQVRVAPGTSFVFVSGLGGNSVRDQERCLPSTPPYGCNGEWASIYSSNQGATHGALFCSFNVAGQSDQAYCYFKDIGSIVPDEFTITNFVAQ